MGKFLSVDPVAADGSTDANFNRYRYANSNPYKYTDPDGRMAYLVDNELGRDVLVIPVFFTGSDATRENIALIASEFSKLRVEGQGGMRLLLQVLPEPRATGTYNTMDLSPGDWDRLGGLTLEYGEGVAGHLGHTNTSRQNWIGATVRDILHFPGIPDGYTDLPGSKRGARRTEPLAGYDGSHNLSTVVINPRVALPGQEARRLVLDLTHDGVMHETPTCCHSCGVRAVSCRGRGRQRACNSESLRGRLVPEPLPIQVQAPRHSLP
ncbi:hypothetical protein JHB91_12885 [Luteimonas sp. MC1828]|nr:hypothetical protein [Luteimonas sp. MC1828]